MLSGFELYPRWVPLSGYQKDKRGRTQFFCKCAVCGTKKVRYVKMGSVPQTGSGTKRKTKNERQKIK